MLIEAGANLNAVAAGMRSVRCGEDVCAIVAADGSTSLHDAAYSGTAQMVALLLSLGCNGLIQVSISINTVHQFLLILQDTEGRTALHWSTYNRSSECIEMLLDKVRAFGLIKSWLSYLSPLGSRSSS